MQCCEDALSWVSRAHERARRVFPNNLFSTHMQRKARPRRIVMLIEKRPHLPELLKRDVIPLSEEPDRVKPYDISERVDPSERPGPFLRVLWREELCGIPVLKLFKR